MKTEFDINQIVWSTLYEELVTIAEIHINKQGITYIDLIGIQHVSADLLAEKPMMTQKQFDKVMEGLGYFEELDVRLDHGDVWTVVKECIKEVQE